MPKRIVEDVVPPERKSIRNIPLPSSRGATLGTDQGNYAPQRPTREPVRRAAPPIQAPVQEDVQMRSPVRQNPPQRPQSPIPKGSKRSRKTLKWVLIILFVVLALGFVLSYVFANATVTVTPKEQVLPVNISLTAHTEAGKADVLYQTITLTREKTTEVPATGEEDVQRKASGSIIIYNNFSADSQVLVKNTRFKTPSGLIYRIQDQVTVPGKKGSTPGSLKVTVYADEAGEKYNAGLQDFVIPGFESDSARFKAITAKSDPTSPLQGGFVGKVKMVSTADKAAADKVIEADLRKEIIDTISAQVPEGYMSIESEMFVAFEDLPQAAGSNASSAKIGKKATAQAIIVNTEEFQDEIIAITSGDSENGPKTIKIGNMNELPISIDKTPTSADPSIKFAIQGNIQLIWKIDETALSNSLAGKSRKNLKPLLSPFSSIEKAEAVVRPFWSSKFPSDPKKVHIDVIEP